MIPLLIYLWPNPASPYGKSILIRAKYGNGIAIDAKCCCEDCCCTNLPDTLYGQVTHLVQDAGCGASFERIDYFELAATEVGDGCACGVDEEGECYPKYWHGIFERDTCAFVDGSYQLFTSDVHLTLQCQVGLGETLNFTVGVDLYDAQTNTTSGVCTSSGAMNKECPLEDPLVFEPGVGDITELLISTTPWS